MLAYHRWNTGANEAIYRVTPGGAELLYSGPKVLSWMNSWGQTWFHAAPIGDYFQWVPLDRTGKIYDAPVTEATKDSPYLNASAGTVYPVHDDGYVYIVPSGGSAYYALASDPATPVTLPNSWTRHGLREGVNIQLDDGDLDGSAHGVAVPSGLNSYNRADGIWYSTGRDTSHGATTINCYGLKSAQPAGRAIVAATAGVEALGWIGEYAIRRNLRLDHILPLPGGRAPAGGSTRPIQERADGYLLGASEIFQRQGNQITYKRGIKIDLTSYPVNDDDWTWPGTEDGYVDGFWELFAGSQRTVLGRMPDYMFGATGLVGEDVMRSLGLPTENLTAVAPAATHRLVNTDLISGTTFATPIAGSLVERRRQLIACASDDRLAYCEAGVRMGAIPAWNARGGRFDWRAKTWTTLVNFDTLGPPGLGETNWTIWSVVPIQSCRALPAGGWLVGATLYFDPWDENDWEMTPGAGESTFLDTGLPYLPALPGFSGPFQNDNHAPILLSGYDEWTVNRSLYGPDAILVYDLDGTFVSHLNSTALYPPDGREIIVTGGRMPKVIFRVYRWGTYSDSAEGWGQYHRLTEDAEIQVPLYVCYDLETAEGEIAPGAGTFRGFVDMHEAALYAATSAAWRWDTVAPLMYVWEYPKTMWAPPATSYVRAGLGGRSIVPLTPGPPYARGGPPGSGHRTRP